MKTPGKSLDYLLVGALLFMMASCAPLPVEIPGLPAEPTATPTTDGNILANTRWQAGHVHGRVEGNPDR